MNKQNNPLDDVRIKAAPWLRTGEIWIGYEDLPLALELGYVPDKIVEHSRYGWLRRPFAQPGSMAAQGRDISGIGLGGLRALPSWMRKKR